MIGNPVEKESKLTNFLEAGSEIAGSVVGTAVGLVTAGPAGAIAGAALGPVATRVISRTCIELHDRILGYRERVRAGAAAVFAIAGIKERLKNGQRLREDGFFDAEVSRSSADEVLEGVMLKSRNDHQEKKVRFYANILINAAFDPMASPGAINHVLSLSDRLTYRQLCLLNLFSDQQLIPLRDNDYRNLGPLDIQEETRAIIPEAYAMYQDNLIFYQRDKGQLARVGFTIDSLHPSRMRRTGLGQRVYRHMGLENLPHEDLVEVSALLQ